MYMYIYILHIYANETSCKSGKLFFSTSPGLSWQNEKERGKKVIATFKKRNGEGMCGRNPSLSFYFFLFKTFISICLISNATNVNILFPAQNFK